MDNLPTHKDTEPIKKDNYALLVGIGGIAIITALGLILYFTGVFNLIFKPAPKCVIAGCSGELCVDENTREDTVSICIWSNSFACYKKTVCEVQESGKCGWTANPEFNKCIIDNSYAPLTDLNLTQ